MNAIFDLATKVATPLALGGFLAAVAFFIFRQIIAKNIFPTLTVAISGTILLNIINKLFILALVAMILGFAGYVVSIFAQQREPAPDAISISLISGTPLRDAARMIAANEGYTTIFSNCDEGILGVKVEPGTMTARTSKELIEALQYRVTGAPSPKKYHVERLKDRGIYDIRCD